MLVGDMHACSGHSTGCGEELAKHNYAVNIVVLMYINNHAMPALNIIMMRQ